MTSVEVPPMMPPPVPLSPPAPFPVPVPVLVLVLVLEPVPVLVAPAGRGSSIMTPTRGMLAGLTDEGSPFAAGRRTCSSHQSSSAVISNHQGPSGAIRGHPGPSGAIRGHQRPSEAIRGHQGPSGSSPCAMYRSNALLSPVLIDCMMMSMLSGPEGGHCHPLPLTSALVFRRSW